MAETPDDILRALADPQRLAIAGALAQRRSSAAELADALELTVARVRKHLNRLTTAGVVRLADDRRTYRLDPETLRWAAEQVRAPTRRRARPGRRQRRRGDRAADASSGAAGSPRSPARPRSAASSWSASPRSSSPASATTEQEVNVIVTRLLQRLRRVAPVTWWTKGSWTAMQGIYWRAGGRVDDLSPPRPPTSAQPSTADSTVAPARC